MKKYSLLILLVILLSVLSACSSFFKPKDIKSTDGKFQVTVPGDWNTETDLNKLASIQVAKSREEMYLIVITEPKSDFPKSFNLEEFTKVVRDQMLKTVTGANATQSESVTVSGNSAMRYELSGTVKGINAKYINTTVETKDHFHQVLCWTMESKFSSNKSKLLEVTNSFKEATATIPATK